MTVRLIVGLILGVALVLVSLALPSAPDRAMALRTVALSGGITLLAFTALGVIIATPILRGLAAQKRERPDAQWVLVQKGTTLARDLAKVSSVLPVSVPTYLLLGSSGLGVEFWRAVPREHLATVDETRIRSIRVLPGAPRAQLVIDVDSNDGAIISLGVIPGSGRSGVFPASAPELRPIVSRIESALSAGSGDGPRPDR